MCTTNKISKLFEIDPLLKPFEKQIQGRCDQAKKWLKELDSDEGGLVKFSEGYKYFGFQINEETGDVVYREWAPNAVSASLVGDFNKWNHESHPMNKLDTGVWEVTIRAKGKDSVSDKKCPISHESKVKISLGLPDGNRVKRLPAWIKRVKPIQEYSTDYEAVFWNPKEKYQFKNKRPKCPDAVKIYEAHVGISSPELKISTYKEFTREMLPRIKKLGYNTILLMAIMEHADYASFGYQVTSFFAASSRYGTPEDLKELVDTAHGMELTVLMDLVHSQASEKVGDGLYMFDGSDGQYFHEGSQVRRDLRDSRLFNYSHKEVLRFLLSNLRFYIEEYRFDGFRFDGVTSILYTHHGIGTEFSGEYDKYFGSDTDAEGINYLILANTLIKKLSSDYISIADDVSGMPTLSLPSDIGGIGFDYRLATTVADMWINQLKKNSDDDWNMGQISDALTGRSHKEKTVAYAESHDQALVGDKTLALWLMDQEIYTNMSTLTAPTSVIERGMALHKMIRFLTHALAEGYLNFEGNEFGHPEWLDFPRAGNNNSFQYSRRQFNLVDDDLLRYKFLNEFDRCMQKTESRYHWLAAPQAYVLLKHKNDKIIAFERANVLFIFNFHPTQSYNGYRIGVKNPGTYKIIIDTDSTDYGGQGREQNNARFFSTQEKCNELDNCLEVSIPNRTAIALAREEP